MEVAWEDLEFPLDPRLLDGIHVDEPDDDLATEIERQSAFRRRCRLELPHVLLVGIPNAGKRGQKGINQARREGALWGFPDMLALAPGRLAFLEWKAGKSQPAPHQIDVLNRLHRMGWPVGVFRRPESAVRWLQEQGFGKDACQ